MKSDFNLPPALTNLHPELVSEIAKISEVMDIPKGTEILREGQYVKVIPVVLEGALKVSAHHDDKEVLLYYIEPNESCVMSFASGLHGSPSKIVAIAEEDTKALLLPTAAVQKWTLKYPGINSIFYQQYDLRYGDLLDTINQILFHKLDERLFDYLLRKKELLQTAVIKITHREIAADLGTAREVVSRVMKKLEIEGKLIQHSDTIELTSM